MPLSTEALNVITAVKYDAELVNAINKMTFLFDPNWQGMGNTLPIAFFYVKDMQEVMDSEISQKPLLFYNSQKENNQNSVAGGLLGVVADNIINKPKKYQMSVIIPRTIDVYFRQAMFSKRVSFGELFHNSTLSGVETFMNACIEVVTSLVTILNITPMSLFSSFNIKDFISNCISASTEDSNKASIEAMWENRTILKMKYWNGWRFKYVAIENFVPTKKGEEDDFYQATLNVIELPILTTRKEGSSLLSKTDQSLLANRTKAKTISNILDKLEHGDLSGGADK